MADFRFTVDTEPMAQSVNRVTNHVDGVTVAVVAMQTAVVIAEKKAADQISNNVNRGFLALIRSQISQKIAKLKSESDSKWMELRQQSAALASIKTRMEKDYMMVSNRYLKLFNSINKSLRGRIFELDKPTATLVNRDIASVANRVTMLSASIPINQSESIASSQVIAASNIKFIAKKTIDSIKMFIADSSHQKFQVQKILNNTTVTGNRNNCFVPIILMESEGQVVRQSQIDIIIPKAKNEQITRNFKKEIHAQLYSSAKELNWSDLKDQDAKIISNEFAAILNNSNLSQRLSKTINNYFEKASWKTLNKTTS